MRQLHLTPNEVTQKTLRRVLGRQEADLQLGKKGARAWPLVVTACIGPLASE